MKGFPWLALLILFCVVQVNTLAPSCETAGDTLGRCCSRLPGPSRKDQKVLHSLESGWRAGVTQRHAHNGWKTVDDTPRNTKHEKAEAPSSVVIIPTVSHSRSGIGGCDAISIINRKSIASLEALFPNYRQRPASDLAGGWEAGYSVYFNFEGGQTIKVTVSHGRGDTWTIAGGDFETNGNFGDVYRRLKQRAEILERKR